MRLKEAQKLIVEQIEQCERNMVESETRTSRTLQAASETHGLNINEQTKRQFDDVVIGVIHELGGFQAKLAIAERELRRWAEVQVVVGLLPEQRICQRQ